VGATILALAIGILAVMVLVILLGAFLIWIPIVGLVAAAAILFGLLRERIGRAP